MGMGAGGGAAGWQRRRARRRVAPVMAEINVTPMVDVMLVLLIVFMVAAPLLTVGVPVDLPQTQASAVNQDNKEPIVVTMNDKGQVFLSSSPAPIPVEELVPKLQAMAQVRNNPDERIFVRGDRQANYGQVMKLMGRLSGAGFKHVALVTEVEQGG